MAMLTNEHCVGADFPKRRQWCRSIFQKQTGGCADKQARVLVAAKPQFSKDKK